jgi:phosphinothricin acetyltransferase
MHSTEISIEVRLSRNDDLPRILSISNWAIEHTVANFAMEPETLDHWIGLWKDTRVHYPWFVAERGGDVVGFAMANPFKSR